MPRTVKRRALIRIEQKDEQIVEHKEHECKGHHEPHFAETDFAQAENAHTYQQERQQHTRVIMLAKVNSRKNTSLVVPVSSCTTLFRGR